ncbi:chemotaxis protein CheA [Acidobacteria bacterium AB60]|nr:chemotaxis protein CheA [Acidobacteria bacterium AB60]
MPRVEPSEKIMDGMDEIFIEFLNEANEVLDKFDRDMVELENDPSSRALLDQIFRGIHTIKGTSGVLGLDKLVSISHCGENLLSKMREGEILLTPDLTTVLLTMSDALRQILGCIAQSGTEGDGEFSALVESITAATEGRKAKRATARKPRKTAARKKSSVGSDAAAKNTAPPAATMVAEPAPDPVPAAKPKRKQESPAGEIKTQSEPPAESQVSSIRVDVGLLDKLMNLVGELVLARNQIMQFTTADNGTAMSAAVQRLNLITAELQRGVMKTRMQPIGTIWNKLPRLLRDVARGCGKDVELNMDGAETELDRTILEAIKDPLTHIIRNAVDHGIEPPAVRVQGGKNPAGLLTLKAYHEGGKVNIEISDDGAGINTEAVKQKAIERNLVSPAEAQRLSERELYNLLFQPGFSTAKEVTNISGRGVGMDVVKSNISKIGGTIDLQSTPGHGTTLKIKIPLTLAIVPALIVTSASNRFAISQVNLVELVRLEGAAALSAIEFIHNSPFYRLRGTLLPIVYLDRQLTGFDDRGGSHRDVITIVVLQADDRLFGLVVDEVKDSEEIVVKPLGNLLKEQKCFAGATIMGDGRVALILDVMGLAHKAEVLGEQRSRTNSTAVQKAEVKAQLDEWLLVKAGRKHHLAIPLARVDRLEEMATSRLEWSGSQLVVQYRGEIVPVISVAETLGFSVGQELPPVVAVVVVSWKGRRFGLLVEKISDVVQAQITIDKARQSQYLKGSAVIDKRVVDVLDIDGIIANTCSMVEELETAVGQGGR